MPSSFSASSRRSLTQGIRNSDRPGHFEDEETVFDIRGQRTCRPRYLLGDDFANEVMASTNCLKSRLHMTADAIDENLLTGRRSMRNVLNEAESASLRLHCGPDETETADLLDEISPSLSKWVKIEQDKSNVTNTAVSRALRSKMRLSDLEQEMEEIAKKQARRKRRTAALRALVNESNTGSDELLDKLGVSQSVHRSKKNDMDVSI